MFPILTSINTIGQRIYISSNLNELPTGWYADSTDSMADLSGGCEALTS
jgi:hypothetical protein